MAVKRVCPTSRHIQSLKTALLHAVCRMPSTLLRQDFQDSFLRTESKASSIRTKEQSRSRLEPPIAIRREIVLGEASLTLDAGDLELSPWYENSKFAICPNPLTPHRKTRLS